MASTLSDNTMKKIRGVFSTEVQSVVGHGATKKKTSRQIMYFAEELSEGNVTLRVLNENFVPSGEGREIPREELLTKFLPEPEVYIARTVPAMQELEKRVKKGDRHRQQKELFTAEFEFKQALRIDEDHVRATFGLGLTFLDRGEASKAGVVFKKLVKMDAAFEEKHKHLLNEFGIKLRKNLLYEEALEYYSKAYTVCRTDEHLLYNMARAFYEKRETGKAKHYLSKALELKRDFAEANEFMDILDQREEKKSKPKGEKPIEPAEPHAGEVFLEDEDD